MSTAASPRRAGGRPFATQLERARSRRTRHSHAKPSTLGLLVRENLGALLGSDRVHPAELDEVPIGGGELRRKSLGFLAFDPDGERLP